MVRASDRLFSISVSSCRQFFSKMQTFSQHITLVSEPANLGTWRDQSDLDTWNEDHLLRVWLEVGFRILDSLGGSGLFHELLDGWQLVQQRLNFIWWSSTSFDYPLLVECPAKAGGDWSNVSSACFHLTSTLFNHPQLQSLPRRGCQLPQLPTWLQPRVFSQPLSVFSQPRVFPQPGNWVYPHWSYFLQFVLWFFPSRVRSSLSSPVQSVSQFPTQSYDKTVFQSKTEVRTSMFLQWLPVVDTRTKLLQFFFNHYHYKYLLYDKGKSWNATNCANPSQNTCLPAFPCRMRKQPKRKAATGSPPTQPHQDPSMRHIRGHVFIFESGIDSPLPTLLCFSSSIWSHQLLERKKNSSNTRCTTFTTFHWK